MPHVRHDGGMTNTEMFYLVDATDVVHAVPAGSVLTLCGADSDVVGCGWVDASDVEVMCQACATA